MKKIINKIFKDLLKDFEKHIGEWEECKDIPFPIKFTKKEHDTFEKGFDKGYHEGIGYAMFKVCSLLKQLNKQLKELEN